MRYGSLFSGIGGADLGFHRAGWEAAFFAESDEYRRRVLARHWPGVPAFEDVRSVLAAWDGGDGHGRAEHERGGRGADGHDPVGSDGRLLDLLCGGFPCQDVSVAGQRRGLAGERSGLFFEFARIAGELVRPGGWIVIENVPGLFTSHGGRDFAVVLRTLGELGFHDLAWRVLDSRYFGVPQRRRRVFIVARRAAGSCAQTVLLEREGGGWHLEAGGPAWAGAASGARAGAAVNGRGVVAGTLGGRGKGGGCADDIDRVGAYVADGVAAPLTGGGHADRVSAPGRRKEDDVNLVGTFRSSGRGWWDEGDEASSLRAEGGGGSVHDKTGLVVSAPVTAKWAKGNGGPAGDEAQNLTFVKRHGANHAEDHETWEEADIARSLNGMGQAGTNGALVGAFNLMPAHGQGADLEAYEATTASSVDATANARSTDRGTRVVQDDPQVFLTRAYTRGKDGQLADTSPSLTKEADRGDGHPQTLMGSTVRRLTPTECERLQALPDGWTYAHGPSLADVPFVPGRGLRDAEACPVEVPPDSPRYAGCGDAVTASVAEWIADRIARVRHD